MYYYIMDSPKDAAEKKAQEKIKDYLGLLGIAGETVLVSPARSAEELTNMGLEKKYSTIVAVGGDRLVNKIASLIQGTDIVLGVIPINASPIIQNIIGTNDIKQACENLRFRKLKEVNLAHIEPNKYYLTDALIINEKPFNTQITIDDFYFEAQATEINVDANLNLVIQDEATNNGFMKKLFGFLGGKETQKNISSFHGKKIRINTSELLPVIVDGEIVAKTPIAVKIKQKALKIIIARDKIVETKE